MVQAAWHRRRDHRTLPWIRVRDWTLKRERSVRAVMVVVVHELSQHPSEMTLADHDDVSETLPADGLHEPFCDRVRFRRPRWRRDMPPPIRILDKSISIRTASPPQWAPRAGSRRMTGTITDGVTCSMPLR